MEKRKGGKKEGVGTIEVDSGIVVNGRTQVGMDYNGMRTLVESGMHYTDVAHAFKTTASYVRKIAKERGWLRPTDIERLRKDIEAKQARIYRDSGKTRDVNEVKAQIWQERSESIREKTYGIIEQALDGVSPEQASKFIKNPLGLLNLTNAARLITGEEKQEANSQQVAVNISFLRSNKPTPVDQRDVVDV